MAVKRLPAEEGSLRWVLRDPSGDRSVRLGETDADLLALIDGSRTVGDLVVEAERAAGTSGAMRLAGLLSDLSDQGFLDGAEAAGDRTGPAVPRAGCAHGTSSCPGSTQGSRASTSRRVAALHAPGGDRPGSAGAGQRLATFVYLVVGRYGTQFVVDRVGIGGLVFLAGRLVLVAFAATATRLRSRRTAGVCGLPASS